MRTTNEKTRIAWSRDKACILEREKNKEVRKTEQEFTIPKLFAYICLVAQERNEKLRAICVGSSIGHG